MLAESGAIIDYILSRHGEGRLTVAPPDPEFPNFLFWLRHFAGATLGAGDMMRILAAAAGLGADHPIGAFVEARAVRAYDMIEARLGEAPYFGGAELTVADIMMVFHLTTSGSIFHAPRFFPDTQTFSPICSGSAPRPAYQRAMAKGDTGMALLLTREQEGWDFEGVAPTGRRPEPPQRPIALSPLIFMPLARSTVRRASCRWGSGPRRRPPSL